MYFSDLFTVILQMWCLFIKCNWLKCLVVTFVCNFGDNAVILPLFRNVFFFFNGFWIDIFLNLDCGPGHCVTVEPAHLKYEMISQLIVFSLLYRHPECSSEGQTWTRTKYLSVFSDSVKYKTRQRFGEEGTTEVDGLWKTEKGEGERRRVIWTGRGIFSVEY